MDHGRVGGELVDHDPPILPAVVVGGFSGRGDVRESGVGLPHVTRVVDEEWERDHVNLYGGGGDSGGVGGHAVKRAAVFEGGDQDIQGPVFVQESTRIIVDQFSVWETPVDGGFGISHGFALERDALTFHDERLGDQMLYDERWFADELFLLYRPEVFIHQEIGRGAGFQVIFSG